MTKADAQAIVGILVAAFPKAVGQQTIDLYSSQIESYDVDAAMTAVMRLSRQGDRFPSLAVLLGAIHQATPEPATKPEEEPVWVSERPHWTRVHQHARAVDDHRLVPEQIPGCVEIGHPLPPLPWNVNDEKLWIQPGEYGYAPTGYDWTGTPETLDVCCFHAEEQGLPLRTVMIVGPRSSMKFSMCLRCAATYETRRAA